MAPLFTNFHFGFGRASGPSIDISGPIQATGGTKESPPDGYVYHYYDQPGTGNPFQITGGQGTVSVFCFGCGGGGGANT